ncbi:MAG: phosphatase-like protein [Actinomycetia bacterium]|nr:phosphatase-like protein [Actinomycetes bacterium]
MNRRILWMLPVGGAAVLAATSLASSNDGPALTSVPAANVKAVGYSPSHKLAPELMQVAVAQGSTPLENPNGLTRFYGYQNDIVSPDDPLLPQMVPTATVPNESQKTEPDKNTYLVLKKGLAGGDPQYDYGSHFLFQGHEIATRVNGVPQGYVTRINLDANAQHRVTLVATQDSNGKPLPTIDGSTWDPFAQRLLFTSEGNGSSTGGTWQATLDVPAKVDDLTASLGRGGFEGIQNDSAGNVWIVEDIGGSNKVDASSASTPAKRPNSFVYRFVPDNPSDLTKGKLQALQVLRPDGSPITFESQLPLNSPDQLALHTYGTSFETRWVTVHDTATAPAGGFDANAAAKLAHATPFKRPENGVFRPGTKFTEFYFDETGDTNATSPENASAGGWGSLMKLTQSSTTANSGRLSLVYASNASTAGLDNVQFLGRDSLVGVQDMGDTLHTQTKSLDSGYVWDLNVDYSKSTAPAPLRWLAEGRDPSATIDSAAGGYGKNDGDNEITGVHVSDGDPTVAGILGAKIPQVFDSSKWRWFWNEQHGDNVAWEVLPVSRGDQQGNN